jgi:hypothetical protein
MDLEKFIEVRLDWVGLDLVELIFPKSEVS